MKLDLSGILTCRTLLLLLLISAGASAAEPGIRFDRITGEKNTTAPAFQAWYTAEMERQGGPGKSHGWWPWGLRAFDFDNDGILDLLASHHGTPHSMLLRGTKGPDGTLTFADVTKQFGIDNRDLPSADDRPWVWDFDGDGYLDIAGLSDEGPPRGAWNRAGKAFAAMPDPIFKSLAHPREVVDLNGDGFLDLDGGSKGQWFYDPEKKSFRPEPKPRFATPDGIGDDVLGPFQALQKTTRFFQVEFLTHDLVGHDTFGYDARPIDLDADGKSDVVARGSGGYGAASEQFLVRQPDGKLLDRTAALGLPQAGAPILIRDLTGDGAPEVLVVSHKSGGTDGGLFLNDGKGAFRRIDGPISQFLDRRGPYLIRAYPTDFDDDGQTDLVLSNPRMGVAAVYHNRGQGQFAEVLKVGDCWDSNPIAITDLDGDGRVDLAIGVRAKNTPGEVQLFMNRTPQAGHYLSIAPRMAAPNPFAVGAVVEVFAAGELARKGARPIFVEKAHPDATPIHAGLGDRARCDVRVTFPGGKIVERNNVEIDRLLTIAP